MLHASRSRFVVLASLIAGLVPALACSAQPAALTTENTDSRVFIVQATPGRDVTVEPDRLIFVADGHEDLLAREPGDILVCSNDCGFLRAVVSVSRQGASIVVATVDARLGDAIIDGAANETSDMPGMQGKWDMPGKYDGVLPFDGSLQIGDTSIVANGGATVNVKQAYFDFKPSVSLGLDIEDRRLAYFEAIAEGTVHAGLVVQVTTEASVTVGREKELWRSDPKLLTQWIGPVPVVETVELAFGVGAELSTDAAVRFDAGGEFSGTIRAGATYDRDASGWRTVGDRTIKIVPLYNPQGADVGIELAVYLYAELEIKFYAVAGPFIQIAPYVNLAHENHVPDWHPKIGMRGDWGGNVEIFGSNLAGFESPLFDYSKDL